MIFSESVGQFLWFGLAPASEWLVASGLIHTCPDGQAAAQGALVLLCVGPVAQLAGFLGLQHTWPQGSMTCWQVRLFELTSHVLSSLWLEQVTWPLWGWREIDPS